MKPKWQQNGIWPGTGHTTNFSIWETEAGTSLQILGQPDLYRELQASQSYLMRHCLGGGEGNSNKQNITNRRDTQEAGAGGSLSV